MRLFTIKSRLIVLISIMLLLLASVGLLGLSGMNTATRSADALYKGNLQTAQQLAQLNERLREAMMELAISAQHDPRLAVSELHDHPTQMHLDKVEANLADIDALWADIRDAEHRGRAQTLTDQFDAQYQRLLENGIRPAMPLYADAAFNQANEIVFVEAMPPFRELIDTLAALIAEEERQASASYQATVAHADQLRWVVIGVLAAGLILGALLGTLLMRRILRPLGQARHHLQQMAEGDFTAQIHPHGHDEVSEMLRVLADSRNHIRELILNIQRSAESISTASVQISSGNTDLAQRTEEEASSLQETAASMEEVATTVKHNTDHTGEANQLAHQASSSASQGGERVEQAVQKMHDMARSSEEISSIISMIDGIAFQTNILALNASVEAARAGEQGRGFAVVAGEVRKLAQRSAESAKQIQALIDRNGEIVHEGSQLVEGVGTSMQEIVDNIARVSTLMEEVNRASEEQTRAVEQVNVAISQMDRTTQQNAALVEQTDTASSALEAQARDLASEVRFFRVGNDEERDDSAAAPESARHSPAAHEPTHAPQAQEAPAPRRQAQPATTVDDWESF
ncbi:MAG: methyl-accepting chemotaxis protein [Pseudomonadota bacterium]